MTVSADQVTGYKDEMSVASHWSTQVSLPGNISKWCLPSSRWESSTLLLKLVVKLVLARSVLSWTTDFATNGKKAPNQPKFLVRGFWILPVCLCCEKKIKLKKNKSESVCYHLTKGVIRAGKGLLLCWCPAEVDSQAALSLQSTPGWSSSFTRSSVYLGGWARSCALGDTTGSSCLCAGPQCHLLVLSQSSHILVNICLRDFLKVLLYVCNDTINYYFFFLFSLKCCCYFSFASTPPWGKKYFAFSDRLFAEILCEFNW